MWGFEELFEWADAVRPRLPVVAVGGADRTVLVALSQGAERGWVEPVLAARECEAEAEMAASGVDPHRFRLLTACRDAAATPEAIVSAAVAEVKSGRAALLMKGQVDTPTLMKGILSSEHGLRTGRVIAQVVLMEILRDRRVFLLTDTGVTVQPTLPQKADLLAHLVELAHALESPRPRIAIVSASEKVSSALPDTAEAAELAERAARGEFGPCDAQGPLSFDLAYASDAGEKKRVPGSVVGQADGLLFPNLLAANLTVKGIMYTADCRFGGVLMGTSAPVVFMSRSDTPATRLHSLALALRLWFARQSRT